MKRRKPSSVDDDQIEIPGTAVRMPKRNPRHEDAPHTIPYVFNEQQVKQIAIGVRLGLNVALTGPTGCGKSTLPTALAAYLGHPLIRFNCHGETRVSNMVGMDKPAMQDGVLTLKFSRAALIRAMEGGYWVLFDEIDAALPSVLFVLQAVLEEGNRRIHVPEMDREVRAAEGFQVFATGNTIGYRSIARASHAGTNPLNDAFIDRFGMVIACDYPERQEEIRRVAVNCPETDRIIIDGICRVAESLRADERFKSDFSTRRCVQWSRLVPEFGGAVGIYDAAECSVLRKLRNPTDAQVAREIMKRIFEGGG